MGQQKQHISVYDLEIYQLARKLSQEGFQIYDMLHWQDKKVIGDQFLTATDSVGANITEGYARYHFWNRVKFCYIARGSLAEATDYWLQLLLERDKITKEQYSSYHTIARKLHVKLNNFVSSMRKSSSRS